MKYDCIKSNRVHYPYDVIERSTGKVIDYFKTQKDAYNFIMEKNNGK